MQLFQAESTPFREARQHSANHILSGPWGLVGVGTELCLHTRRLRSFFSVTGIILSWSCSVLPNMAPWVL